METVQFVNRENLRIARENVGYSTRSVTDKVCSKGTKTDKILEWEESKSKPTWKQLEKLAKQYEVNKYLLTSSKKIKEKRGIPDFRKLDESSDVNKVKKFLNFLLDRQNFLESVIKDEKSGKNTLVGSGKHYTDPERLAAYITDTINFSHANGQKGKSILKHLIEIVESKGVFVMKTLASNTIEVKEMRGVYLHNDYAPIIALNRKDSKTAQLFTLAHELTHLFINKEGISNETGIDFRKNSDGNKIERFCNEVASNIVLPKEAIPTKLYTLIAIEELAKKYGVSPLATFYRLKSLNLIDKRDIKEFEEELKKKMKEDLKNKKIKDEKSKGGGDFNNNMKDTNGSLYNTFILSVYFENKINVVEANNLLRMSVNKV